MTNTNYNLKIDGMTCINCKKILTKKLLSTNGVLKASINLLLKEAYIIFDSAKTSIDEICKQITNLGFKVIL